ncbi:MAG: helix-turn-helix domain-containing protein [Dehalococcoidia bacterium]
MTNLELGKALAEARIARGLSLRDAERDTRINGRYLQALEDGALDVMPAPVYARAFMRTYAQYLGLDSRRMVQELPGAKPEPELPPLPQVTAETTAPLISAGWIVAIVVAVVVMGSGLLLFWNRSGGNDSQVTTDATAVDSSQGFGSDQPTPPTDVAQPTPAVEPGIVPDLAEQNVLVAIDVLSRAQIPYVIVEVPDAEAQPALVLDQTPAAGTNVEDATVVTLTVSR